MSLLARVEEAHARVVDHLRAGSSETQIRLLVGMFGGILDWNQSLNVVADGLEDRPDGRSELH